jgi:hypothetical protein
MLSNNHMFIRALAIAFMLIANGAITYGQPDLTLGNTASYTKIDWDPTVARTMQDPGKPIIDQFLREGGYVNLDAELVDIKRSKASTIYCYQFFYAGIPIHHMEAKIKVSDKSSDARIGLSMLPIEISDEKHGIQSRDLESYFPEAVYSTPIYYLEGSKLLPGYRIKVKRGNPYFTVEIFDLELNKLSSEDLVSFYHSEQLTDTTVKGYVFMPDPVTSANTVYGGNFVDNSDQTNPFLDNERVLVDIEVTDNAGTLELENQWVKIVDMGPPALPPATSTGDFLYDRSQSGFEDVNTLYHISNFQAFLIGIGYSNITGGPVNFDPHGDLNDNSYFLPGSGIFLGIGGVDDAEDADVIIHEYGHAVSNSIAGTNSGMERQSLDEGFGDYLAASYSNAITSYRATDIFTWDGHNVFWSGRSASVQRTYDQISPFDIYYNGEIWSSALFAFETYNGRAIATDILLESMYSYLPGMNMKQAADLMIDADTTLYGGASYPYLCYIMKDYSFVDTCTVPRPSGLPVLVIPESPKEKVESTFELLNSDQFGNESITVNFTAVDEGAFEVNLYNTLGQQLNTLRSSNQSVLISPENLERGIYFIEVIHKGEKKVTFKVIRQ